MLLSPVAATGLRPSPRQRRLVRSGLAVFVAAGVLAGESAGQAADSLHRLYSVIGDEMTVAHGNIAACRDSDPQRLLTLLDELRDEQERQSRLNVTIEGAITSDDAPVAELTNTSLGVSSSSLRASADHAANVALSLSRGSYPAELSFTTEVGLTLDDDTDGFRENISRVRASYDHYFHPAVEAYVFFDRLSNDFLSIDQRYEAGFGLVFDVYPVERRWQVGDGTETVDRLSRDPRTLEAPAADTSASSTPAADTAEQANAVEPVWGECYVRTRLHLAGYDSTDVTLSMQGDSTNLPLVAARTGYEGEVTQGLQRIQSELRDARVSVTKRHAFVRPALLIGINTEFEQASLKLAQDDTTRATVSLRGTQAYLFVWRPTLAFRFTEQFGLRVDWYNFHRIAGFDSGLDERSSRRQDIRVALSAEGSVPEIGSVTVSLEFRRLLDATPPFLDSSLRTVARGTDLSPWIEAALANGPVFARDKHDRVQLKVGFTF